MPFLHVTQVGRRGHPFQEAQLCPECRTIEDRAALPSWADTPGLFVHIRAMFYSAHLEKPQHKQVCLQNDAVTSTEFCSFSDLVEPSTFLNEKQLKFLNLGVTYA